MSRSDATGPKPPWPELLLSTRPFSGGGSLPKGTGLDCLVRFSDPAEVVRVLRAALERGVGAIMPMNDATLLQALDLGRASCPLEVYPVIPNAIGYVRDATDHGMVGAGIKHLRRMHVDDLLGIGVRGLASLRRVLLKDFRAILPLLVEVEMAAFKRFRPRLVLLHSQVTDLVVALGNHQALRGFASVIRSRFGAEPGLVTCNYSLLTQRLAEWSIDIDVIVAPFNLSGFLMKPTREVCESLVRETNRYVIADRIGAAGVPLSDEIAYLRQLGIRSAVVEVTGADAADFARHQASKQGRFEDGGERHAGTMRGLG